MLKTLRATLFASTPSNGKEIWRLNILKKFAARNITWGLAESLLVDGQHVICCPGGPQTAVVALDKKTGEVAWKSPSADGDPTGYATPLLIECGGLRILLTMTGKALIGVDADSGELLFRHEHITSYDVNAATPLYRDGRIFITSGYGSGSEMLKLTVDGQKGQRRAPLAEQGPRQPSRRRDPLGRIHLRRRLQRQSGSASTGTAARRCMRSRAWAKAP